MQNVILRKLRVKISRTSGFIVVIDPNKTGLMQVVGRWDNNERGWHQAHARARSVAEAYVTEYKRSSYKVVWATNKPFDDAFLGLLNPVV